MKKSFVLYQDQYPPIKGLTQEQKGYLLDALFLYQTGEPVPEVDPVVMMAFSFFKQTLDRDEDKYLKRCYKNRENVRKRWNTKDTIVCDGIRSDTKHTGSGSGSGSGKIVTVIADSDKEEEPSAPPVSDDKTYLTKKKKKLTGKRLETFERFWNTFDYKRSKSEAADSWLEIPELTNELVDTICYAAERERIKRPDLLSAGQTPKMPQGWLSSKRWEDEHVDGQIVKHQPVQFLSPGQRREENNRLAGEAFLDGFNK